MSCFSPLLAIPYKPTHPKYGQYMIVSAKDVHVVDFGDNKPFYVDSKTGETLSMIRVACGKCIGCRLDYSREWASRIVMESMDYPDNSIFLTFTYSDDNVPCTLTDGSDKVIHGIEQAKKYGLKGLTLRKKDTQDFWKRLRRQIDYNFDNPLNMRYYCAGEYGGQTHRPHYHACVFGVPDDLVEIGKNKFGDTLYDSPLIRESWGLGHITIGKLDFKTAAYTARYTLKKAQGEDHVYNDQLGIAREFVTMSRKPGLGVNYFLQHKDEIYEHDEIVLPSSSKDKPNVVKPPRYFDILFNADSPVEMAKIKQKRGIAAELDHAALMADLKVRNLDEMAYLEISERAKENKIKSLSRGDCLEEI